jgi:hypothetical protein
VLAQLLTVLGELVVAGVFILGLLVAGAWLVAGFDRYAEQYARVTRPDRPPRAMAALLVRSAIWRRYM